MLSPNSWPALVLNADFRPLSYFPLSLWPWQETVKAVFLERVNIVSEYEEFVHSPTMAMRLPSVISLKEYIRAARRPAFTRFNVFLRDYFTCQYCGTRKPTQELTFDHLVPRSRGGRTTWENVVTACGQCNLLKGNRLPREFGGLSARAALAAQHLPAAAERPRLPAQLPASELARLSLLGHRARSQLRAAHFHFLGLLAVPPCVLRDAPLRGAPQDEANLCVAEKLDLILRSERSERLEGPPHSVRGAVVQLLSWRECYATASGG